MTNIPEHLTLPRGCFHASNKGGKFSQPLPLTLAQLKRPVPSVTAPGSTSAYREQIGAYPLPCRPPGALPGELYVCSEAGRADRLAAARALGAGRAVAPLECQF